MLKKSPYWLEVPALEGKKEAPPAKCNILVIGSGFSGSSCGYFLQKEGFDNIVILDDEPTKAATFRNCGHILHGTVESMKAFSEIHGADDARELWKFSVEICELVKKTVTDLKLQADYRQDGYLVIALDETENQECIDSTELLKSMGFESTYLEPHELQRKGFKNVSGARFEPGSAQAHPTKFRNGVLQTFLDHGGEYFSSVKVTGLEAQADHVIVHTTRKDICAEAVVLATNAYTPLVDEFFASRKLIEPFRGQIITSSPLKHRFPVRYPHSFDHGYEYSLVTEDNRLMIGGWRDHTPTKEIGTYSLETNPMVEEGLMQFVQDHYEIAEKVEWEFSWSGIMGASSTSLPFIGPTQSERVFACGGYTGHGFSWGHGSAALLAKIMAGSPLPSVARHFNPKKNLS